MPRNVEIKARLRNREAVEEIVRRRADHGPELIVQKDTFFECVGGRLKLRAFDDGCGEMIFYRRADVDGPAESEYFKAPTQDAGAMTGVLGTGLGVVGVVRKRRTLYLVGQTRVHLDEVEGLGHYLELEVMLEPGQAVDDGVLVAHGLMRDLGIDHEHLEARAYIDLLTGRSSGDEE